MHHNMDKFNIVKYHGQFTMKNRIGLVFDMLDISLQDYLIDLDGLMRLEDIRTVISQVWHRQELSVLNHGPHFKRSNFLFNVIEISLTKVFDG